MSQTLVIRNARVLTLAQGARPRRGAALGELGVVDGADVVIRNGAIVEVTAGSRGVDGAVRAGLAPPPPVRRGRDEIDVGGRVLMPAFVDCHTHACFAGSRLDEWEMKLRGAPYLEILKAGGGIMSTVRAVRSCDEGTLVGLLLERLHRAARWGTAAIEVKSGYGLSMTDELRMLRAIRAASEDADEALPEVVPTALLGHAIDPYQSGFVERTIHEALPAVSAAFPGVAVDAYCEEGAWSVSDTVRLLARARELGHPVRVHADQFNSLGMVREAVRLGAMSVDHLEASSTAELEVLAASETFGVMLPVCGLHLDGRYANAGWFVKAGGALCLASNFNPGSAPSLSMPLVVALAVRHMGLTVAEAIAACTVNPATLLGLSDRGVITPAKRADLIVLSSVDERSLAYGVDAGVVEMVVRGGRVLQSSPGSGV